MNPTRLIDLLETHQLVSKTMTIERGAYLCHAGMVSTDIYYLTEGSVQAYVLENEEEQIIRFGYKDNIIVALDSFLSGAPSSFYMQALKKTTAKVIQKEHFMAFIQAHTDHLKLWAGLLEDLVLQQIEREIDILTTAPKERYERVLQRSPQLFQEIPHKYIANYLRMSPETLSRLKKS
ncbi:Crp/Fnr family transcriptional regulator [Taibaiella sp. KBW10]|uniref:Crp/Fnr family transcriptional regulator n=1 Tax=Taibaiella sp. KBW10 TaxID=2153357 RepID=UPI000F5ADE15|nr:Crp/Fnr family transcriptional regulator [Taibaiella sp. KBW10]RQO32238.1 Crp/Fnr family transcriptional regulator [Taibaiella sp. KBW10]